MITADIEALRDWILQKNQYFNAGFADAWQDPVTGLIAIGENERISVGVDDHYGNYFYIRIGEEIVYSASRMQVRDGVISQDETARGYLVAVVDGAKPKGLAQCLLNSLIRFKDQRIRPVRSVIRREQAVANELRLLDKEDLQHVLQNLGGVQVVTIEFQITTVFHSLNDNCPCSPCKDCADE